MATTFHMCAVCPNQACQCPIPLGCLELEEEDCSRAPGDFDHCELVCQRCGTRFELVADTLALWPVITTRPLPSAV